MTRPKSPSSAYPKNSFSRRTALQALGAGTALGLAPGYIRYAQATSSEPLRLGFQVHRTGIGAAYGRWYERTTNAAVKVINDAGGISGRPVEIVFEDDGTDPKRGAEVVEKFASQHKVDITFGTLFSHVVMGAAPRAGELKMPYFVVSEGHHEDRQRRLARQHGAPVRFALQGDEVGDQDRDDVADHDAGRLQVPDHRDSGMVGQE
jgi:branched-chain amino acid transport system substrate-binding protein